MLIKSQTKKTLPAQIMLVTLLTLMILAIITVSVVTSTRKDVQQTVNTREYESLFATSEESILTIIDKYGKLATDGKLVTLAGLPQDMPADLGNCVQDASNEYSCVLKSQVDPSGVITTSKESEVSIKDIVSFNGYELSKDQSLTIDLQGYAGEIRLNWEGQAALDFGLVYRTAAGEYGIIRDVYDLSATLDSTGGDPYADPQNKHSFAFAQHQSPASNSTRFILSGTTGLPANSTLILLTITPRIRPNGGIAINVSFGADGGLPTQMREILARSYDTANPNTVTASVRSLVPIFPQAAALLEYVLLVDGQVAK